MTPIAEVPTATAWPLADKLVALAATVALRVKQFARVLRHRSAAAILARFDDRMLADIGLTRSDLRDALSEPLWRDPTAILATRVEERRGHRRWTAFRLRPRAFTAPSIVPTGGAGCDAGLPMRAAL